MKHSVQAGTVMQLGPQLSALRAKRLLCVRAAGVCRKGERLRPLEPLLPALWPVEVGESPQGGAVAGGSQCMLGFSEE